VGCSNVKISCDDGDVCTIDRCHCENGCEHFPVDPRDNAACTDWTPFECSADADCNDDNSCTDNSCKDGSCYVVATDCDDSDPCTIDSCYPSTGCGHVEIEECVGGAQSVASLIAESDDNQSTDSLYHQNQASFNGLGAGPIAGIVVGVVAFIAVISMIGYKLSQKTRASDDAYKAM